MCALQGAAVRVELLLQGAVLGCCQRGACALELACWCRCRVLLQGASVRVVCALWSWRVGAALEQLQKRLSAS